MREDDRKALADALADDGELKFDEPMSRHTTLRIGGPVDAGASTGKLLKVATERELGGVEFLGGVPGTVGGGMIMNAGTYLGEFKDVTVRVWSVDERQEIARGRPAGVDEPVGVHRRHLRRADATALEPARLDQAARVVARRSRWAGS